ncbi:MAG TPA: TolC family protein [Kofleriaceae bacterium]|nr:TolC family protein [Kofleriaceae bacterium]
MRLTPWIVLAIAATPAAAEPQKLTLDQLTAKAIAGPRTTLAQEDTDAARARVDEADAARLPKATGTGFLTISPEIHCVDVPCTQTAPAGFALQFSGAFGGLGITITQPLYTFGKIATAQDAAHAGVRAQAALEDEAAGDAAVDAARAYYGLKLARELRFMLEEGIDEIVKAKEHLDERVTDGSGEVTIQDQQRVATLLAEAKIQLEDAKDGEAQALAGVHALVGSDDVDIDDAPLAAVTTPLSDPAKYENAASDRPQVVAAREGALAAHSLADFETRQYYPDFAVLGTATWADAQGVDRPPSWIYSQPYHVAGVGLALVLRWNLDPWTTHSHVLRAEAQARHADTLAELARTGATLEIRNAYSEASRAKAKVDAATDGEKAAHTWVASVLQNDAIGTADPKDLADAYIAWFQMRARLMQAIFQWDVATVRLRRATGEFRADAARPKETR